MYRGKDKSRFRCSQERSIGTDNGAVILEADVCLADQMKSENQSCYGSRHYDGRIEDFLLHGMKTFLIPVLSVIKPEKISGFDGT